MYGRCPVDFENDYAYTTTIANKRFLYRVCPICYALLQSVFCISHLKSNSTCSGLIQQVSKISWTQMTIQDGCWSIIIQATLFHNALLTSRWVLYGNQSYFHQVTYIDHSRFFSDKVAIICDDKKISRISCRGPVSCCDGIRERRFFPFRRVEAGFEGSYRQIPF